MVENAWYNVTYKGLRGKNGVTMTNRLIIKKIFFSILLIVSVAIIMLNTDFEKIEARYTEEMAIDDKVTKEDIQAVLSKKVFDAFQIIRANPETYQVPDGVELTVGDSFSIPTIQQGVVKKSEEVLYFPIVADGKIIAFTNLIKVDGQVLAGNVSQVYAEELNEALHSNRSQRYAIVRYQNGAVLAITENGEVIRISTENQYQVVDAERLRNELHVRSSLTTTAGEDLFIRLNSYNNIVTREMIEIILASENSKDDEATEVLTDGKS